MSCTAVRSEYVRNESSAGTNLHKSGGLAGEADGIDRTDGLRIHFAGGDIIHLRPSGNAPELRCYTESDSPERAAALNGQALSLVRDYRFPG